MESHDLIELAALVAWHGPAFVKSARGISPSGMEQYWRASKSRLDGWNRALKQFTTAATAGQGTAAAEAGNAPIAAMQEILVSDVLTRTWTAVVMGLEQRLGEQEATPMARSILLGQMEARNRVLSLLVDERHLKAQDAVALNRLRRRTERWIDLLISRLAMAGDVCHLAMEPQRAEELAGENTPAQARSWPIMLASLRMAFRSLPCRPSPNRALNEQIGASIMACLDADRLEANNLPGSIWMARLFTTANDAESLVNELLRMEEATAVSLDAS